MISVDFMTARAMAGWARMRRREPDRGCGDVHERPRRDSENRQQAGGTALVDAAADDVEHRGPGNREQRETRGDEHRIRRERGHGLPSVNRIADDCSARSSY